MGTGLESPLHLLQCRAQRWILIYSPKRSQLHYYRSIPHPGPLAPNLNCNRINEHENPLERMLVVLCFTFSPK